MKEKRKKQQKGKQRQKRARESRSYSERVRAKGFCCAFKFTSNPNLGFALSIILKQRELKACCTV